MEKVSKQHSVDIQPKPFHNDNLLNAQLDNTGKRLVALKPTYPLYSGVYPISEVISSTPFNLLI